MDLLHKFNGKGVSYYPKSYLYIGNFENSSSAYQTNYRFKMHFGVIGLATTPTSKLTAVTTVTEIVTWTRRACWQGELRAMTRRALALNTTEYKHHYQIFFKI